MALMTVVDAEEDSKVSRHTWRAWIRQGRIAVTRLGRRVRIEEGDYRKFLEENRTPAREERGGNGAESAPSAAPAAPRPATRRGRKHR